MDRRLAGAFFSTCLTQAPGLLPVSTLGRKNQTGAVPPCRSIGTKAPVGFFFFFSKYLIEFWGFFTGKEVLAFVLNIN